jgi:hypothetical protein
MKSKNRFLLGSALFSAAFLSASLTGAQQPRQPARLTNASYSLAREAFLLGTVVKYDPASSVPPVGAHVLVQTSAGQVDVHLGNAKVLQGSHLELNSGDSIRIVGEPMVFAGGTFFAARIVQKGTQAVAVRSPHGALLRNAPLTPAEAEALRGVR